MTAEKAKSNKVRTTLLKPFHTAALLTILALLLSLGFLAYTAWTSAVRIEPLERHMNHLAALQQSSINIQELLVRHFEEQTSPSAAEITKITKNLKELLDKGDSLHRRTPDNIRQALQFLESSQTNIKAGLSAALTIIRDTIRQESELQRSAMLQTHHASELEFAVALTALLVLPVIALAMLIYVRRRSFHSINQLSLLLDNVGNLDFRTAEPAGADDPLASVYERYNDMAEKLHLASKEAQDREARLERQVRAASETLLRQQAELENGARLAAIGEFSARMAHELRNPISGISVALQNLEREVEDTEHRERIALIAEEMERVTKLLNGLLERGRMAPETPSAIATRTLVNDVVRLFACRLPETTEIVTDVEEWTCRLPRDTFRQVLINLLKNSSEAIGETPGIIRVSMRRDGDMSILTVSDNGPGFPEEMLTRGIFPFQTRKEKGMGLGMSIIQRLVNSAGGDIRLGAAPNGGAMTTVTLPCGD